MSNLSQFFSGGGSQPITQYRVLPASGNFKVSRKGKLLMMVVAGGASGGVVAGTASSRATGGGTGEVAYDVLDVNVGDTFTATVGAGGAAVSTGSGNLAGNNGGDTTVVGPSGYSIEVKGGSAGLRATTAIAVLGGAGGTGGVGGSPKVLRFPGGRGGNIDSTAAKPFATGGGAVDIYGIANTRGGDIGVSVNPSQSGATGGGGIGGRGGDLVLAAHSSSGGGGSGGSPADGVNARGLNALGENTTASPSQIFAGYPFFGLDVYGGGGTPGGLAGPGGGGGGSSSAGAGGLLGGGGGLAITVAAATAGSGGLGAGGGGCCNSSASTSTSGAGGGGFVVFVELGEI